MDSRPIARDIGPPVYDNDDHFEGIKAIVRSMVPLNRKALADENERKAFFDTVRKRFDEGNSGNIQSEVRPENLMAMWETWAE